MIDIDAKLDKLLTTTFQALNSNSVKQFCQILVAEVVKLFENYNCCILLIHDDSNQLIEIERAGENWTEQGLSIYEHDVETLNDLTRSLSSKLIIPSKGDTQPLTDTTRPWSKLIIPIINHDVVIGVLYLCTPTRHSFHQPERDRLVQFVDRIASVFTNLQFYENIQSQVKLLEVNIKQYMQRLESQQKRLETILNSTSDAIVITDNKGTVQQYNPAFKQLYKINDEEISGKVLKDFIHTDDEKTLTDVLNTLNKDGHPQRVEVSLSYANEFICYADIAVSTIQSEQPPLIIYSIRDATVQRQLEYNLRDSLRQEKESDNLRTRFVSMVSHEFRTPLATIQSAVDLLSNYLEKMTPEQRQTRLNKIKSQITHMTLLLEDVLTVGRIETGKITFEPAKFNLNKLARAIVSETKNSANKEIDYVYFCNMPEQSIFADQKLMRQIITNLLSNAVKYSAEGSSIELLIHFTEDRIMLQVKDSGIGIPLVDQPHLFDPFHRGTNVGSIQGTGLGLAITKHAVDIHKGTIEYTSTFGVGTTFTVYIAMDNHQLGNVHD